MERIITFLMTTLQNSLTIVSEYFLHVVDHTAANGTRQSDGNHSANAFPNAEKNLPSTNAAIQSIAPHTANSEVGIPKMLNRCTTTPYDSVPEYSCDIQRTQSGSATPSHPNHSFIFERRRGTVLLQRLLRRNQRCAVHVFPP